MLAPEELAALTAYHEACKGAAWRYESEILRSGGISHPLSQNAHSAIAKLLERVLTELADGAVCDPQRIVRSSEDRTALHEAILVRGVLTSVSEFAPDAGLVFAFGGRAKTVRRPHHEIVTEAVHATLAALGFSIRPDGSLEKP